MGTKSCTEISIFSTRFSCENLAVENFVTLVMGKCLKKKNQNAPRHLICLGIVSTNLYMLVYAGEIQNSNCRRLEMATDFS